MDNNLLLAFDNDGVLRDESVSYLRCIRETVAFFSNGEEANEKEMLESMKQSNDDWERTFNILVGRGVKIDFEIVKNYFQDLYLGTKRDFTGYINDEPWLANNELLKNLSKKFNLAIVSGAPKEEILYQLRKNEAEKYFKVIFGMNECEDKLDGIKKLIEIFHPDKISFCDDRPSPLKKVGSMKNSSQLNIYGILPPKVNKDWTAVLLEAGAEKVFADVNEYCKFILSNENY